MCDFLSIELRDGSLQLLVSSSFHWRIDWFHWFSSLVLLTGSPHWFSSLVLLTGWSYWLVSLVGLTGLSHWHISQACLSGLSHWRRGNPLWTVCRRALLQERVPCIQGGGRCCFPQRRRVKTERRNASARATMLRCDARKERPQWRRVRRVALLGADRTS